MRIHLVCAAQTEQKLHLGTCSAAHSGPVHMLNTGHAHSTSAHPSHRRLVLVSGQISCRKLFITRKNLIAPQNSSSLFARPPSVPQKCSMFRLEMCSRMT